MHSECCDAWHLLWVNYPAYGYEHQYHFYHGPDVSRAIALWPPIRGVTKYLKSQTRANMSAMVCNCIKRVDFLMSVSWMSHDCLMTVSWLSHDCLMTEKKLFGIRWSMGQCRVGPCFFFKSLNICFDYPPKNALGSLHYTLFTMHYKLSSMHFALCTMYYTLCTMQYALCNM